MAYVPIPVRTPRTPKGRNTFLIFLACIFLVVGVCLAFVGLTNSPDKDVSNLADLSYSALEDGEAYYTEDAYVLTEYAVYSIDDQRWNYYLIGFTDKDGEVVYASLQVEEGTTLSTKCKDYMEYLKNVGDDEEIDMLALNGVFSCEEITDQPDDIVEWYEEKYEEAVDVIAPGQNIHMNFTYEAENKDAYAAKKKNESTAMSVAGVAFAAGGAIALFFLIRHRRKMKEEEEAAQMNFNGSYPGDVNGGYGTPYGTTYGAPYGSYTTPGENPTGYTNNPTGEQ